jgi:hypothetical protein
MIFSKPNSSLSSPPKLTQYLISAGLQALAQMDWMIGIHPAYTGAAALHQCHKNRHCSYLPRYGARTKE